MYIKKISLTLAISLTCISYNNQAATLIKNKDGKGSINTILIEKNNARMENNRPEQYMLVQFRDKKLYNINTKKKQIIDMAVPAMKAMPKPHNIKLKEPTIKAELVKKGVGPQIAGFDTMHYQMKANDKLCSDQYFAIKALEIPHIKDFMQGMQEFAEDRRKKISSTSTIASKKPCMLAKEQLNTEINALGYSMRSLNENGRVKHEVIAIETNVNTDAKTFNLPETYATVSPFEMMQNALLKIKESVPMTSKAHAKSQKPQ